MKKKKPIYVRVPLYGGWVIGILGYTHEEAEEFVFKKYKLNISMRDANGWCLHVGNQEVDHFVIFTDKHSYKPQDLAVLVHETLHASLLVLSTVGQGVNTSDHEYLTYLQQHIFQSLLEAKK